VFVSRIGFFHPRPPGRPAARRRCQNNPLGPLKPQPRQHWGGGGGGRPRGGGGQPRQRFSPLFFLPKIFLSLPSGTGRSVLTKQTMNSRRTTATCPRIRHAQKDPQSPAKLVIDWDATIAVYWKFFPLPAEPGAARAASGSVPSMNFHGPCPRAIHSTRQTAAADRRKQLKPKSLKASWLNSTHSGGGGCEWKKLIFRFSMPIKRSSMERRRVEAALDWDSRNSVQASGKRPRAASNLVGQQVSLRNNQRQLASPVAGEWVWRHPEYPHIPAAMKFAPPPAPS